MSGDPQPRPFRVSVSDEALADLHRRLSATRWPDEPDAGWAYGVDPAYVRELVAYWQDGYDWHAEQERLNALPHFQVEVDGVRVHYVHHRSERPDAVPLLLVHGWPDTFDRFSRIAPLLTAPSGPGPAFDLVIPSLPGFGFSDNRPLAATGTADLLARLMSDVLGHDRFVTAGGDVGSLVSTALARAHPDLVSGVHLTDAGYPTGQEDPSTFTPDEARFAEGIGQWWQREGAYAALQSTKPQTLAYALNDSPVGLAAWIVSFIATGADDGDVEAAFGDRTTLLTDICLYWFTGTAGSAARAYAEQARETYGGGPAAPRSAVPAGFALFPREAPTPREWVDRVVDVRRYTPMPAGGHFAALEVPDAFAEELRTFVREHTEHGSGASDPG